jgi:RhtB (resistance to homoserine/threonine) family protein
MIGVFLVGSLLIIMSPGPDFVYVMTQGVARGRWAGMLSAVGISTGLLCHTLLAALGLTALIMASPWSFDLIKYIGAAYLVYLGVKSLRNHGILAKANDDNPREMSRTHIWRQGMLTNLLNPKALLTFLAFIPQFITTDGSSGSQVIVLGLLLALVGVGWFSLVGYCAGMIGEWLSNSKTVKLINRVTGGVLIGLGVRLTLLKS